MQHISSLKEWDDVQKEVMETLVDSFVPIMRACDEEEEFRLSRK